MTLQIRQARAEDAGVAVALIHSSGPAAFDYVFAHGGADARAFLARAFVDGAGEFGHRNHVVGEHQGHIVAVGAGFGHADAKLFAMTAARQIMRHYKWHVAGPLLRGLRTERVIRPPARGEYYLAHLAVAPAWRGHGFGTTLVEWLAGRGRRQGHHCVALDVAADNPRAQALYERLGFHVCSERHSRLRHAFGAVPAQRRMQRALTGDNVSPDEP